MESRASLLALLIYLVPAKGRSRGSGFNPVRLEDMLLLEPVAPLLLDFLGLMGKRAKLLELVGIQKRWAVSRVPDRRFRVREARSEEFYPRVVAGERDRDIFEKVSRRV